MNAHDLLSAEEARKQTGTVGLKRAPVVVRLEAALLPGGGDAFGVGMPAPFDVSLRGDNRVRAHCVQVTSAERAAIGRSSPALRRAQRPPAWLLHSRAQSELVLCCEGRGQETN